MATGRRPDDRLSGGHRRAPRERRQAQRWAALSRERLAQRQAAQLLELQGLAEAPQSILRRLALVAPVLIAQEKGEQLQEGRILERNVGCHAQNLPRPGAPRRAWRIAQRGPRLPRPRSLLSESRDFPTGSAVSHVADVEAALLLADSAARAAVHAESEGHVQPSEYVDTLRRDADLFWPLRPPGRWDDGGVVKSGTEEVGTGRTPLRSSAEPFLLSGSGSQRRSDEGVLCSCGAVLFSSCRAAAGIVGIVQADDVCPGGTAGRAPLPPASDADGGATAGVPGASCDGSDVDDVTLDGEADADTSCSDHTSDGGSEGGGDGDDGGAFGDHAVPAAGESSPLLLSVSGRLGEAVSHNDSDDDSVGGQGQEHADGDAATACSATAASALSGAIATYLGVNEAALLRGDGDGGRTAAGFAELAVPTEDAEGEVRRWLADWSKVAHICSLQEQLGAAKKEVQLLRWKAGWLEIDSVGVRCRAGLPFVLQESGGRLAWHEF
ncbi:unnamed protein product [Prorocentrum cordatum]|uniref:Uncharacterized protein n=1 Tax=Prorocentrum cordatum TaxID=2364126 RepID=A0ABN9X6P5_9DINO|nr:unnamed protein product [Polarella glacialis]